MPAKFTRCVAAGGRVRTIVPKRGRYIHVCFPKGGGASISGELHKIKVKRKPKRRSR
jgi:hypothetical protein